MPQGPVKDWWNSLTREQRLAVAEHMPPDVKLDDWRTGWERLALNQQVHLLVYYQQGHLDQPSVER